MSKIESLEREVEALDDKGFAAFRAWFIEYEHARWDRQIEADAASGKLDPLIEEALAEHRAGKTKPLWSILLRRRFGHGITLSRKKSALSRTRASSCWKRIERTRRYTSRNWERFGLRVSARTIERSP